MLDMCWVLMSNISLY